MFNVIRDSIFKPREIIKYRTKPWWFVLIYVVIFSLVSGFSIIVPSLTYSGLSYTQKQEVVQSFSELDSASIDNNGVYHGSSNVIVSFGQISFGFVSEAGEISDFYTSSTVPTYVVAGDSVYTLLVSSIYQNSILIGKLTDLSPRFNNVNLKTITTDSEIFIGIDEVISEYKPSVLTGTFFIGFFEGAIYMLGYALFAFLLVILFFHGHKYMKKSQLYKMMLFGSTAMVLVQSVINMLNISSMWIYLLLIIGFIPLYIIQRELFVRIRMFQLAKDMRDQNLMNQDLNINHDDNDDNDNDEQE